MPIDVDRPIFNNNLSIWLCTSTGQQMWIPIYHSCRYVYIVYCKWWVDMYPNMIKSASIILHNISIFEPSAIITFAVERLKLATSSV